jgi:hypothetical protein
MADNLRQAAIKAKKPRPTTAHQDAVVAPRIERIAAGIEILVQSGWN